MTVNSSLGMWLHPGVLFPGLGGKHVTTWPCSPASASSSGDADSIMEAGFRAELIWKWDLGPETFERFCSAAWTGAELRESVLLHSRLSRGLLGTSVCLSPARLLLPLASYLLHRSSCLQFSSITTGGGRAIPKGLDQLGEMRP